MSAPARILVVDDDARHAESVRALLDAHGYAVTPETDSRRGLALALDATFDVLLLDLNMPRLSGVEFLEALGARAQSLKTIVLSGATRVAEVTPVLRLGAYDYLPKPYEPAELVTSVRNAVDRLHLERDNARLKQEEDVANRRHEFLVTASLDLIYMLDTNGCFSFVNGSLADVFGYNPAKMLGRHWSELVVPGLHEQLRHRVDERRSGQRATRRLEVDYPVRGGGRRVLEVSAMGLYDGSEPRGPGFRGTYGIVRDRTAEKQAELDRLSFEAQLQQSSKMEAIGQLAGGIAHDFNNILASIIGYTELALVANAAGSETQSYLKEVVVAGQRARDLVSQMLTFTRAHRGKAQLTSLGESIGAVARMLRAAIPSTIRIDTELDSATASVLIDPVQLQQVVINLLVNARDAIHGSGRIAVRVNRVASAGRCASCDAAFEGEYATLSVADTGHGIAADVLPRMFEMFVTTREPGHGTGFGLWLVHTIVHEYGGHVGVATGSSGTTFNVYLPIASAGDERASAGSGMRAPDDIDGDIVVVDDEVSMSNFIAEVLRDAGYRAHVFNDGAAALDHLEGNRNSIALVLVDHALPHVTGLDVAAAARRLEPEVPVAVLTGYADRTDQERLKRAGVARVLNKPFRIDALLALVRELALRRPARRLDIVEPAAAPLRHAAQ